MNNNIFGILFGLIWGFIITILTFLLSSIMLGIPAYFIYDNIIVGKFNAPQLTIHEVILCFLFIKLVGSAFNVFITEDNLDESNS